MTDSRDNGANVRVAFVGTTVPDAAAFHGPAFSVAGQKFVRNIVNGLNEHGLTIDLFTVEPLPAFPRSRRLWGRLGRLENITLPPITFVPFLNLKVLKVITSGLSLFPLLLRWAWRHRRETRVVCLVNLSVPPAALVLLASRLIRARTMVILMDVWRPGHIVPNVLWWRFDFWLNQRMVRRFDGHMVVSQAIADDLVPGQETFLLDSAVDPAAFRSGNQTFSRPQGRRRLVLAGGLSPHNGVEVVLRAFEILPSNYELVIAGYGILSSLVEAISARNPQVRYVGLLETDQLLDLYRSGDLLLNLRLTKAIDTRYFFPSKLMEMLASGTPVLSTPTGHTEPLYGPYLYLLRDETPEGVASRIEEIFSLDPSERGRRAQAAMDFALTQKSWATQTASLADYIRQRVVTVPDESQIFRPGTK